MKPKLPLRRQFSFCARTKSFCARTKNIYSLCIYDCNLSIPNVFSCKLSPRRTPPFPDSAGTLASYRNKIH